MGAWGAGPFENDGALDWAGDLDDAGEPERVQLVRAALQMPLDFAAEYLDRDEGAAAVAAAELVLAQIQGRDPGLRLEPPLEPLPTAELGPLAARALGRVLGADSELAELWADAQGPEGAWAVATRRMREQLSIRTAGA